MLTQETLLLLAACLLSAGKDDIGKLAATAALEAQKLQVYICKEHFEPLTLSYAMPASLFCGKDDKLLVGEPALDGAAGCGGLCKFCGRPAPLWSCPLQHSQRRHLPADHSTAVLGCPWQATFQRPAGFGKSF